jgi:NitT/TauT family transport system permease protein
MIGPLSPIALLPLDFVMIPSSWIASVVDPAFHDVAGTMGAKERFLVFHVALPATLPQIFVGLFMGLGASFIMLVVIEMLGVKTGLGFYMQWAQG